MKLPRPRVFLSTLLLLTLTGASGVTLWMHWDAWYIGREWNLTPLAPDTDVIPLQLSSDGRTLITWEKTGNTLRAWEILDGRELGRMENYVYEIHPMLIDSSPRTVLVIESIAAKAWDLNSGKVTPLFPGVPELKMQASNNGKIALVSGCEMPATIWDIDKNRALFQLPVRPEVPKAFFSPDPQTLILHYPKSLEVWSIPLQRKHHELELQGDVILGAHFSPSGKFFCGTLIINSETHAAIWETQSGRLSIAPIPLTHLTGRYFRFSSNDRLLAMPQLNGRLDVWDCERNDYPASIEFLHHITIHSILFSADGRYLFVHCSSDLGTYIDKLDTDTYRPIVRIPVQGSNQMFVLENQLIMIGGNKAYFYRNRRPENWWGVAYLPEFWITLLCSSALLWSLVSNFNRARATPA